MPRDRVHKAPSFVATLVVLTVFLVVGGPLAYFLWHELSSLLYGRVHEAHLGLLAVAAALFWFIVRMLGRFFGRFGSVEEAGA